MKQKNDKKKKLKMQSIPYNYGSKIRNKIKNISMIEENLQKKFQDIPYN